MKSINTTGEDEIPIKLLKIVSEDICGPLSFVINKVLQTGVFPDALKTALVKPIYKKGDKSDLKNYRPIALLSNVSKIFEKVIHSRLVKHLDNNDIISDTQNGFRKGRSTTGAIYRALYRITESLNGGKTTLAVCLDLSKAFDSVDHGILLSKLRAYGVRGVSLRLMRSYLDGRSQCVIDYNEETGKMQKSSFLIIKRGVPQGSILGPLLYLIYTNDLPSVVDQDIVQYADDASLIFSGGNMEVISVNVSEALNALEKWFTCNNLKLNVGKTESVAFSSRGESGCLLEADGMALTTVDSVSFLGVRLDSRMSWGEHIKNLCLNMSKYCYALRVVSKLVGVETAIMSYHAYIQARIRYGIIFWGSSSHTNKAFIMQKKCLRAMLGMKQTDSCRKVFSQKNILTLTCLYIYESVMFVVGNKGLFEGCTRKHKYSTRNKCDIKTAVAKYTSIQKSVHFAISKIFNKLPQSIRNLPKEKLKTDLKTILLKKSYYTLNEYFSDQLL